MGDAFKGLTIRIGADVRPLKSALASIDASARGVQKSLNAMTRALDGAPSDARAFRAQLGLAEDKLQLTARRARELNASLRQTGQQTVKFSAGAKSMSVPIEKIAGQFTNVESRVQGIRAEFTSVNTRLQSTYDTMAKIVEKSYGVSFDDALAEVKKLRHNIDGSKESLEKFRSILKDMPKGTLRKLFNTEDIDEAAQKLMRIIGYQRNVNAQLNAMKKIKAYKEGQVDAARAAVELRKAASEATRYRMELAVIGKSGSGLEKATNAVRRADAALQSASAEAHEMNQAFANMPRSMSTAIAKAKAFKNEQDAIEFEMREIKARMSELAASPGFDKKAIEAGNVHVAFEKAAEDAAKFGVKVNAAREKLVGLTSEMRALVAAEGSTVKDTDKFKKLKAEILETHALLRKYKAESKAANNAAEVAAVNKEYNKLEGNLISLAAKLQRLHTAQSPLARIGETFRTLRTMGYGLYSTLTPAISIGARYAIQAANDVDTAYRNMRKTVNGTEEEFEHLKDAAIEFSRTHVTKADTMLEIEAMGGQLGIQVENLESFAETISNLDIATDIGAEDMAKYAGQLSNIMRDINQNDPKQYSKDLTSFSDALVRLGNNSAAQESSIMKVMMRIASLGTISGFTTPELLAISTAVAATGQGCEAAGTAISKTFSNIEAAVGAGGDTLDNFAKVSGMSSKDFVRAWNSDPITAFNAFIAGLKNIDDAGGSVDNTLRGLKISSVRQKQALEGLVTTYDVLQDSLGMSQDAWNGLSTIMSDGSIEEAGDAAREAARKSEGFSGELQMMKNNAIALATELAEGALPIIKGLGDTLEGLTGIIREMPAESKTTIVGLMGILASIGPLTVGLGAMGSAVMTFIELSGKVAESRVWKAATRQIAGASTKTAELGASASRTSKVFASAGNVVSKFGGAVRGAFASAGSIAGVMAVTAAIGIIVDKISEYIQHADAVNEASINMFGRISKASYDASQQVGTNMNAINEAIKHSMEFEDWQYSWVEDVAESMQQLRDKANEAFSNNALIENYANVIENLMSKTADGTKLTAVEQSKLKLAVDGYNKATGESIKITDAETAALKDSNDEAIKSVGSFKKLANAKKLAAIQEYYAEEYAENFKKRREATEQVAEAEKQLAVLQQRYNEISKDTNLDEETRLKSLAEIDTAMQRYKTNMAQAKGVIDTLSKSEEAASALGTLAAKAAGEAGTALDKLLASGESTATAFLSDKDILAFADALDSLGTRAQNLDTKRVEELAKAWDGSLSSIMPLLEKYGISLKNLDSIKIGGKTFYVTDDGTIYSEKGKLKEFETYKIGKKTYYLDDEGTVYDNKRKIKDFDVVKIGKKTYLVDDNGSVYNQKGKVKDLKAFTIGDKTYTIDDKGTVHDQTDKLGKLTEAEKAIFDKYFKVKAEGADVSKKEIESLEAAINRLRDKTVTIKYVRKISKISSATEGRLSSSGATAEAVKTHGATGLTLRRFATGGIVNAPTLIGEAGAEYYDGKNVIPLTNKRYMLPIARAIAASMPNGGNAGGTTMNVYLDGRFVAGGVSESTTLGELADWMTRRFESRANLGA